jgi:hypothetical protein
MDGSFVLMTPGLAAEIFQAATVLDMAAFAVAEVHRAAMMARQDPECYDYSAGWPISFGG